MVRIGLVGEFPNDMEIISSILSKKYSGIEFFQLIFGIHGSELENQRTKAVLRKSYERLKPDYILFIRDLDSSEADKFQMEKRKAYFTEFNSVLDKKGFYLLHIQEIEALLLTDVNILNDYYGSKLEQVDDCIEITSPKDYIVQRIKQYKPGNNLTLLEKYPFDTLMNNCRYFHEFISRHGHRFN